MADCTKLPMITKSCTCHHEYQDEHYGKGIRLHNPCIINNEVGYRCTVCGKPYNSKQPWSFPFGRLELSAAYKSSSELMKNKK